MGLFIRGIEYALQHVKASSANVDQSAGLLFGKVIRPIPFVALVIAYICHAPKHVRRWLLLMTFITNCPSGLARNAAAMIWMPIIILMCGKKLRKNIFMWFMMFALFVLFPFFNLFRKWNGAMDFCWSMDFLNDINFDASEIFMAVLDIDYITWGRQLMGALLFFVPRRIWPSKPIGSGHALVEHMHGWFSNVSMPFFAEGYMNFGYVGIFIFTVALAFICSRLDCLYWYNWHKTQNLRRGYYLILLGAIIFIMRGDMMSSLAYTIGIMVSYSLIVALCTHFHFTRLRLK